LGLNISSSYLYIPKKRYKNHEDITAKTFDLKAGLTISDNSVSSEHFDTRIWPFQKNNIPLKKYETAHLKENTKNNYALNRFSKLKTKKYEKDI